MPAWLLPAAMGLGQAIGGALSAPEQPEQIPTYTAMGLPEQGMLLQRRLQQAMSGGGDFGFGAAAQQANATLGSALQQGGYSGGVNAGGAGGSLLAGMLGNAAVQDAQNRRGYELGLAQANPWVINYQHLGSSPYGNQVDPETGKVTPGWSMPGGTTRTRHGLRSIGNMIGQNSFDVYAG